MKFIYCKNKDSGYTLIEVLLAVSILGIISISILSFFNQSYDYTKKNQSKTVGINVARNVLNYVEQREFTVIYNRLPTIVGKSITKEDCSVLFDSSENSEIASCSNIFSPQINNVDYETTVTLLNYENDDPEKQLEIGKTLIPLNVTVTWNENETTVRGFLKK